MICHYICIDKSRGYKKKYPVDKRYHEADYDARVWQVYNDESEIFDNNMITETNKSLDILLIFVRIFPRLGMD